MKFLTRITLLAVIFVVSTSLCPAQNKDSGGPPPPPAPAIEYNPNSWKTFSSDAGFSISMPGTPTYSTRQAEGASGQRTLHIYVLTIGTRGYMIMYSDYPASLSDRKLIEAALDTARDSYLAESKNIKLLKEQEIKVEGYAGRELLIEEEDTILRLRLLIAGQRFYQIALIVSPNTAFNTGRPSSNPADFTDFYEMMSSRYFDSFRLLDAPYSTEGEVDRLLREKKVQVYGSLDKPNTNGSGDVIEFKNISRPQPAYPPVARAAKIKGVVDVQVIIDEEGKVIAAQARSGHPLLQPAAVAAARQARFTPPMLKGKDVNKAVKVSGIITYTFTL